MRIQQVLLLFFLFPLRTLSQDVQFKWAKSVSGTSPDHTLAIGTDADANVYSMGTFQGSVDMDNSAGVSLLTSQGTGDIFITKHDARGSFIWARQIGNDHPLNEGPRNMTVDALGNLYITGFFHATLDFDPSTSVNTITCTGTGYAAFLLKLNADGNFVWVRNIAQSAYGNTGYSIAVAPSGNVYVTGTFTGVTDFDPGPATSDVNSSNMAQDIFISKFNSTGNFIWSKQFFANQGQVAYSLCLDAQENVYTTGKFNGISDFDPGASIYNLTASTFLTGSWSDVFISKLNADGDFGWAKQFPGPYGDTGFDITVDPSGNVIVIGEFTDESDFDPGPGVFTLQAGDQSISTFIVKLDNNGQFIWAGKLGGTGSNVQARSIACDASGDLYIVGSFMLSVDFDPGNSVYTLTTPLNSSFIFISKIKADGSFGFAKQIGSSSFSHASCITIDQAKNIYVSGYFSGTPDFEPELGVYLLTSNGSTDGFSLKLSQCVQTTTQTINATACNSYSLNNQTYVSSGTYVQHLVNIAGCDSTLTLNLTIGSSTNVINMAACNSYTWEGHTYVNSGNYSITYIAANGCDSIRKLNLVINSSKSSTIGLSICNGENYQGYSSRGTYIDVFSGSNGCDSTRTLHLTVKPAVQVTHNINICEGNNYWGYSASGIYRDTLITAEGCDSLRILNLRVNPVKRTTVTVSLCKGQSYFAGGSDRSISGVYTDTISTHLGCDSIITTNLTVHELPRPNLGANRDICTGPTLTLNPGSFASYLWQDGSNNSSLAVTNPGIYWVKTTDTYGCSSIDTVAIINLLPLPTNFLKSNDSICQNEKLKLVPTAGFVSYRWSDNSFQSILVIDRPGQYILEVKDQNGCIGRDTGYIQLKECVKGVYIPNGFTPNGDRSNDIFRAIVGGALISFKLEVYNRWGELVFYTTNPARGWDGKVKGVLTGTSVFVWRCSYHWKEGN